MKFKNIHVIINLANHEDESIPSDLERELNNLPITWKHTVVKKHDYTEEIVKKLIGSVDLIVAYGGDGTVTRVAKALIGHDTPLGILPSGTANVIAKEFGISLAIKESIELITSEHSEIRTIDTGLCNGQAFIIRVNFGIMADMVSHTDRGMKDNFGQLAYGFTALDTLSEVKPVLYKMQIDGQSVNENGVSLSVTNIGSIGISDYALLPHIKIDDGLFDVILLDHADFISMLRIAGSTLLQTESNVLKRWKCKEILIDLNKNQSFILDDREMKARLIKIIIIPNSLNILIPSRKYLNDVR